MNEILEADIPFTVTDWNSVPTTRHLGETGEAMWKTIEFEKVRIRMVEYSPGYMADHWCQRGHILYVLKGEIDTELANGEVHKLVAGTSYEVSDNMMAHRSSTAVGATLFIVD